MANINKIINGCEYASTFDRQSYFTINGYNVCAYLDKDKFNTIAYLRNLEADLDNIRENSSFRRGVSNHSEHFELMPENKYTYNKNKSSTNVGTVLIIICIFIFLITTIQIVYDL